MCRFYSWKPEYCLKMPAIRFFAMHDAMKELQAIERIHECNISAISQMDDKGYEAIRSGYLGIIQSRTEEELEDYSEHVRPAPTGQLEGDEAKYAVMSLFATKKRHM